jgi:heme-degrading monooxygenase HmoA
MVAAVATITGPSPGMAEVARVAAEEMEGWLREYDGYRGLIVLVSEEAQRSQVISLWETPAAETRARASRAAMRDHVAAAAGMSVEEMMIVYDVPVLDVLPIASP